MCEALAFMGGQGAAARSLSIGTTSPPLKSVDSSSNQVPDILTSSAEGRKNRPLGVLRKLTLEQADEAVRRYEAGESLAPIAETYGVTRQSMWDLLRRRTMLRDRLEALPRMEPNAVREHRDTNRKRYRSRAKRITAQQMREVRERDGVCQLCEGEGTDFDHILAVALGGQTELANLQLLCHPCHAKKTKRDQQLARMLRKEVMPVEALAESILSAEASRDCAKTYRWPVSVRALTEREAASGLSSTASCESCAPSMFSLRTSPDSYPAMKDETLQSSSTGLMNSGTLFRGRYWTANTLESRNAAAACSLSAVLIPNPASKYFLSAKAAAGILRRVERRGKTLPERLEKALRTLSEQRPDAATTSTTTPSTPTPSTPTSAPSNGSAIKT